MTELTPTQLQENCRVLEQEAALAIGRFVIEFGRLEMELGLAIAWTNGGVDIESKTELMTAESFGLRLNRLKSHVEGDSPGKESVAKAYLPWIASAESLRDIRNQWIHGRWGFRPTKNEAVNVVGLPTSQGQREVSYQISELHDQVEKVLELRNDLSALRKGSPC